MIMDGDANMLWMTIEYSFDGYQWLWMIIDVNSNNFNLPTFFPRAGSCSSGEGHCCE